MTLVFSKSQYSFGLIQLILLQILFGFRNGSLGFYNFIILVLRLADTNKRILVLRLVDTNKRILVKEDNYLGKVFLIKFNLLGL